MSPMSEGSLSRREVLLGSPVGVWHIFLGIVGGTHKFHFMINENDITTMYLRTLVFFHGKCYNLVDTQHKMEHMFQTSDDITMDRMDNIQAKLSELAWIPIVDPDEFIVDPFTDLYIPIDIWFGEFGVEEQYHEQFDDELTISTFDITITDDEESVEECISDEEESMIVDIVGHAPDIYKH